MSTTPRDRTQRIGGAKVEKEREKYNTTSEDDDDSDDEQQQSNDDTVATPTTPIAPIAKKKSKLKLPRSSSSSASLSSFRLALISFIFFFIAIFLLTPGPLSSSSMMKSCPYFDFDFTSQHETIVSTTTPSTGTGKGGYGGVTPRVSPSSAAHALLEGVAIDIDSSSSVPLLSVHPPVSRDPRLLYLTPAELSTHTGADGGDVYLAVYDRIFDVTRGRQFYGPQGGYATMAGRDVSRAFATNCYRGDRLHDLRGLNDAQRRKIDGWYNFYMQHASYRPVGWVVRDEIKEDEPMPNDKC